MERLSDLGHGIPEVVLTSMGDQKMQTLGATQTGPTFRDATYERGTTAHRLYNQIVAKATERTV